MKKTYVKPELYFENFELSSNIATGCSPSAIVNHSKNSCTYSVEGIGAVFLDKSAGCTYIADNDDGLVCYHISTANDKLFSS